MMDVFGVWVGDCRCPQMSVTVCLSVWDAQRVSCLFLTGPARFGLGNWNLGKWEEGEGRDGMRVK